MNHGSNRWTALLAAALLVGAAHRAAAQDATMDSTGNKHGGSDNVHMLSHVPLGGYFASTDIELEQDPARPYAYVGLTVKAPDGAGFAIIDLKDPENAKLLRAVSIPNASLHQGFGGMDGKIFALNGKHYYVQSYQFLQNTPDANVGAIVYDVSGLPDPASVKEVARISHEVPGGFHNIFAYKHSDGRALLFTTVNGGVANIYDLGKVVAGAASADALVGTIPDPVGPNERAFYHDFYVAYDPASGQDRFYGAGGGGYYVFDVTDPANPKQLTSITGVAGVTWGHTFTPGPNGRYAVTETEYQYAPLRIFDLKPGLTGETSTISRPISAWTADWRDLAHNHEVRWPYVFVSAYEDGLWVFSLADPAHPETLGHYYTCECRHETGFGGLPDFRGTSVENGAFGVDVRNADGLIVISDSNTGFWAFRMDGFDGWNGADHGMPNVTSAQDWENGPAGASR